MTEPKVVEKVEVVSQQELETIPAVDPAFEGSILDIHAMADEKPDDSSNVDVEAMGFIRK